MDVDNINMSIQAKGRFSPSVARHVMFELQLHIEDFEILRAGPGDICSLTPIFGEMRQIITLRDVPALCWGIKIAHLR